MTWNVRIGINPISWVNDDLPSLGAETSLDTVLNEGTEIGYEGFELGNRFPSEPQALKAVLASKGVRCVSGWYSGHLADGTLDDEIERCSAHMEKLRINDCRVVVYGEVSGSIQGQQDVPLARRPQFRDDGAWHAYAQRLNAFGEHLKAAYGLTLAYHHHMGAYVESPEDIDRLMSLTQPAHVGLLFDTGHAYFGGAAQPAELLKRHLARVVHVHCRDVRAAVVKEARNGQWSFLQSVLNGAFTVPGDGDIDFAPVLELLRSASYNGWLVVEAEQDPAVAPARRYASLGHRTLRGIVERLQHTTLEVA